MNNSSGSLTVIGSGIKFASHLSLESKAYIEQAELVLMLVSDKHLEEWLSSLNKNTINLSEKFYHGDQQRTDIYQAIADYIVGQVKQNQHVCFVTYGHPGVFASAPHNAIKQTQAFGYPAKMTPGISAEDCLLADLLIDPADHGCQQYEVTQFLVEQPKFDPHADLILWQIGSLGNTKVTNKNKINRSRDKLIILKNYLLNFYPGEHLVTMYIAAIYPGQEPVIDTFKLDQLERYKTRGLETLFVPHYGQRALDQNMLKQLGLSMTDISG